MYICIMEHVACLFCFTGIINMAWELQQRKSAETTSSITSSGRSKSHFGVQKSQMSSADVSKCTTLEDKAKHGKRKTSTDATEGSSKSRTHRKKSTLRDKDDINVSSITSTNESNPASWQWQRFKSHEEQFLMLGPGSRRDKLYKYKKVLSKHGQQNR